MKSKLRSPRKDTRFSKLQLGATVTVVEKFVDKTLSERGKGSTLKTNPFVPGTTEDTRRWSYIAGDSESEVAAARMCLVSESV